MEYYRKALEGGYKTEEEIAKLEKELGIAEKKPNEERIEKKATANEQVSSYTNTKDQKENKPVTDFSKEKNNQKKVHQIV